MTHNNTFGMILDIVYETMPRDNLLNSACLELFEFIRRENIKPLILHIVEKYRSRLQDISYVDTFASLVRRYEQNQGYLAADTDSSTHEDSTMSLKSGAGINDNHHQQQRWQQGGGVREMDAVEEEYFNTSDDEEEMEEVSIFLFPYFPFFFFFLQITMGTDLLKNSGVIMNSLIALQ